MADGVRVDPENSEGMGLPLNEDRAQTEPDRVETGGGPSDQRGRSLPDVSASGRHCVSFRP